MNHVHAMAAHAAGGPLAPYEYTLGDLGTEEVEIAVETCGVCHSDLSVLDGEWGAPALPLVPGHEVIGKITAVGSSVKHVEVGQRVGLGWFAESCMHCDPCMGGTHNLCASSTATILGRHGGFASHVRCHWAWAVPLPDQLDATSAGPLFCGGITVFSPIVEFDIAPTDQVAVIGIGGLGHLALQFLNKWGCEVTAFTSTDAKAAEARALGAHHIVNSRDADDLKRISGKFDFILNTTNVSLDWGGYLNALAPNGRLHTVGAVLEPMAIPAFSLIGGQKSVSGSPLGSPRTIRKMLEFCARHGIAPQTEVFSMADANTALQHLRDGNARYRVVLAN